METLQRTANRGSVATGYNITNSVKLEADNNEWFYNASPTAGNRRTYTYSFWIKRTGLGTVNASGNQYVMGAGQHGRMFFGSDTFQYRFDDGHVCRNVSRKFRDTSAWYHFVVAVDTTQSTASNRVKLYVNGDTLEVDDHDGGSFPDQNDEGAFFSTNYYTLGTGAFGGSYNAGDGGYDMRAYLAEVVAIDGQQLTPTSFGEYDSNGIWIPKDVSGLTFGSQGFYLTFATASDMGDDKSGNGNDLTENNLTSADQATDTPTNNFCTLNMNWKYANVPSVANCIDGGTIIQHNGSWSGAKATMGVDKGKWYWECKIGQKENTMWGIQTDGEDNIGSGNAQNNKSTHVLYSGFSSGGYLIYYENGSVVADTSNYSDVWVSGDIAGIALDMDNNQITYYRNGSGLGSAFTAITIRDNADKLNFPFIATYREYIKINFGGYSDWETGGNSDANGYGSFQYSVPSGYYALCTKNLAEYG